MSGPEVDRLEAFVAETVLDGVRLDVAVAGQLGISRSRAAARIAAGDVTVDGRIVNKQHRMRAGERIAIAEPAPPPAAGPAPPTPPIRFEDEHLLVVAKPAGLVVHPGAGTPDGTLIDALLAEGGPLAPAGGEGRPGVVHRLDRDTSGLLMVARTDAAHAGLVEALRERRVTRHYLALVAGIPRAARGRIEGPIGRDPGDRLRFAVVADGKPAVTRYRTLATGTAPELVAHRAEVALLACRLESGRTHQIRVHLTTLGHPIVGDPTYGRRSELARSVALARPFLHAAALAFDHPITGERIDLVEPLPEELAHALDLVGIDPPTPELLAEGDVPPAG
jgi:23S rRNA pseudouridine1911/1915/1917 synthase